MAELREDHPFNDYTPDIAERAKELARRRGHRGVDHIIICSDGVTHGLQVRFGNSTLPTQSSARIQHQP